MKYTKIKSTTNKLKIYKIKPAYLSNNNSLPK